MNKFKKVNKEEFDAFVKSFREELYYDVCHVCDPPLSSYNDFSEGKVWPESIVAKVVLWEAMADHPAYKGEENEYQIKIDSTHNLDNIDPK